LFLVNFCSISRGTWFQLFSRRVKASQ
jgi:hypothetical protein